MAPYGKVSAVMDTIPVLAGSFSLIARFDSNQLVNILGDEDVYL